MALPRGSRKSDLQIRKDKPNVHTHDTCSVHSCAASISDHADTSSHVVCISNCSISSILSTPPDVTEAVRSRTLTTSSNQPSLNARKTPTACASSSEESGSTLFPVSNTVITRISPACCTLTWSQARITPTSEAKIPDLSIVFVDVVRGHPPDDVTRSTAAAFSAPVMTLSTAHENPAVGLSKTVAVVNDMTACSTCKETVKSTSRAVERSFAATATTQANNLEQLAVMQCPESKSPMTSVGDGNKPAQTSCVSEVRSTVAGRLSSSTHAEHQLLVWLRSSVDSDIAKSSSVSPQSSQSNSANPGSKEGDMKKVPCPEVEALTCNQVQKRTTASSFNIANLMKPTDESSDSRFPVLSTSIPSRNQTFRDCSSGGENDSATADLNGATSELFPPGLDTAFFECLQSLPALTTPEPLARPGNGKVETLAKTFGQNSSIPTVAESVMGNLQYSTDGKRNNSMPVDLSDFLPTENPPCQHLGETSLFSGSATRSSFPGHKLLHVHQPHVNKNVYISPSPVPNFQHNATSLWQPAIVEQTPSRSFSISDCFSPLATQYANYRQPQYGQNLRRYTQVASELSQPPANSIPCFVGNSSDPSLTADTSIRGEIGKCS